VREHSKEVRHDLRCALCLHHSCTMGGGDDCVHPRPLLEAGKCGRTGGHIINDTPAAALAPRGLLLGVGVLADLSSRRCCALRVPGWRVGLGAGELRLNSGASTGCQQGAASCRQLWLRSLCMQVSRTAGWHNCWHTYQGEQM
jgi:hypothetical protein